MMLAAVGSERLGTTLLSAQESGFVSRWHEWPDMHWAGPEHWGNRLQDWRVANGGLVCGVRAPNRTLHCLTHTATGADFATSVDVVRQADGRGSMLSLIHISEPTRPY